jgi:hypothetical protein
MFLSGTILRQIAQPTPALTRPTRRPVLEKMRLQHVMARCRHDQEASRSVPAIRLPNRCEPNRAAYPLVAQPPAASFRAACFPAAHSLATHSLATPTPRAATAADGTIGPAGPVRGRRDGPTSAWDHARVLGSDQASGSSVTAHQAGRPGSRRAAHYMGCDLCVTAKATADIRPGQDPGGGGRGIRALLAGLPLAV